MCHSKHHPPDDGDMRPSPTHSVTSLSCRRLIRKTLLYNCCKIHKSRISHYQQKPQTLQLCELMLILINLYLRVTNWNFHNNVMYKNVYDIQQDGK